MIAVDDLATLPAVAFAERASLPNSPAVYFVLDAAGTVLYIGQSICLGRRWSAHHRLRQLSDCGAARIAWLTVSDSSLLVEVERACIEHFDPLLNGEPVIGGSRQTAAGEAWITVRVPDELKAWLDAWAARDDRSVSYIIRRILTERHQQDGRPG